MSIRGRSPNPARIHLRQGTSGDLEFLWRLQCEAMRPNVERQFGPWDESFQRELFHTNTDPCAQQVIELDGEPVGCQWVRAHPDALELRRLQLLPDVQGRGIGGHLVRRLIDQARASGRVVRLQVFRTSPAHRLYSRLGFATVAETDTHYTMEYGD